MIPFFLLEGKDNKQLIYKSLVQKNARFFYIGEFLTQNVFCKLLNIKDIKNIKILSLVNQEKDLHLSMFSYDVSHISIAVTKSLWISSLIDSEVTVSGQLTGLSLGLSGKVRQIIMVWDIGSKNLLIYFWSKEGENEWGCWESTLQILQFPSIWSSLLKYNGRVGYYN